MKNKIQIELDSSEVVQHVCNSCTDEELEDLLVEIINYRDSKSVADKIMQRIDCYGR